MGADEQGGTTTEQETSTAEQIDRLDRHPRFQKVVGERNELRAKLATLQAEVQTYTERAATADTLAAQVRELTEARKTEAAQWAEERGLLRAGLTDPEALVVARALHSALPEEDRPALADWVAGHAKKPGEAPKALAAYLPAAQSSGSTGTADTSTTTQSTTGPGLASTRTGRRTTSGSDSTSEPMSAEAITAMAKRCSESGDWSEYKKAKESGMVP